MATSPPPRPSTASPAERRNTCSGSSTAENDGMMTRRPSNDPVHQRLDPGHTSGSSPAGARPSHPDHQPRHGRRPHAPLPTLLALRAFPGGRFASRADLSAAASNSSENSASTVARASRPAQSALSSSVSWSNSAATSGAAMTTSPGDPSRVLPFQLHDPQPGSQRNDPLQDGSSHSFGLPQALRYGGAPSALPDPDGNSPAA